MAALGDTPHRYGPVSRALHWGMAILFAAQFLSAAARWALPRGDAWRDLFWSYHVDLGSILFMLVVIRGAWGLANLTRRPPHEGLMGRAAAAGHAAIYALMIVVPGARLVASAGSTRGLEVLGLTVFPPRDTEIAWMTAVGEWHGEMGWILAALIAGHVAFALGWHRIIRRDGVYERMTARGGAAAEGGGRP
ncbi:cytochrome b561 [Hasllibacter halocynthiae]|uniref:Cytochrome b561 n=1 Tax=Hasllibacter halocynthiae TaxID=595589 RepID=A0A2T0X1K7_9RHOB|nr:cytochrome b [Hasllibacter halocynthiae]PRY92821.1 cytochrome b561 [Hasllibacter halocynthiae]